MAERGGAYAAHPDKQAELERVRAETNVAQATGRPALPPRPKMKVSREDLKAARIPVHLRDYCAHLLIPLNTCRYDSYWLPWKCNDERHAYENCQHKLYEWRKAINDEERAQAREAA